MVSTVAAVGAGPSAVQADPPFVPIPTVALGVAQTFGVLTPAAIGNAAPAPATVIRGDMGAGGAVTGFPPGQYTGTLYEGATEAPAMSDLQKAYDDAKGRPAGTVLAGDFGGTTAGPGVHTAAAAAGMAAAGVFTIDGEGHPDAVFIFQVNGALALGANIQILLINGAQAKNVFWQVNGAGAIGARSAFAGTLMAFAAVDSGAGSTINGRLLSLTGAITMSSTQLYSAPPTMTLDGGPVAYTTDPTPLISGTTSARSPQTVSVSIDGVTQTPAVTPSSTGVWSYQAGLLINGNHNVVASSVDGAGNVGSASQVLTVDTTPPAVTIDGGTPATTNDVTPTITGTTDIAVGQSVSLTMTHTTPATTLTGSAIVQGDHTWNFTPGVLAAGEWTIVAQVVDPAGNTNTATQVLTVDTTAPSLAITSAALTNDPTPTISGTSEAGSTITARIDGLNVAGVTQVGTEWSATTTVALTTGTHNVSVSATNTVGNSTTLPQTLTVDLVAPIIGIDPGTTDTTNDRTPTISGTTDVAPGPGVIVRVSIDGAAPLSALVQPDGWNVTPSTQVATGDRTIVASVTDPAGNIGTFTQTLTVDTTAPIVDITGGPSRTTADATPTITGVSADAAIGSAVTVQVNGQTMTTTIGAGGAFSATAATLPNATHFVFVTVTDAAGNTGNDNQSLTVNAVPPTVTFANGPAATTTDSTPQIAGTTNAAVGSAVVVTVATQTLNATVQPGGSWNVTAANLFDGDATVVASITDPDGNVGTATQTLTVDTGVSTTISIAGGPTKSTNDSTPTISGTTNAGDGRTLTVTIGTQTRTTAITAGAWSVTATALTDGIYNITASVGSGDGAPAASSQSLTIDTVAPVVVVAPPTDTTDTTPPITGGGVTPGSTVTVTVAGQTMTTTVAPDGTWTVTPPNPLPAGSNTVTIIVTDPAGNTGTGTQIINVSASPPGTSPGTAGKSAEFTSVGPKRVFDTRPGQSPDAMRAVAKTPIGGPVELQVQMTDLPGFVPASGVGAVSLNVTSNGATSDGYITVYACGTREVVSSVNFTAGQTVANAVITPVSASGAVCFYANKATDVIVDINGWFATGAAFSAVGPKRLFDTRPGSGSSVLRAVPAARVPAGGMLEVQLTDLPGYVPASGVAAVSLNVVVTNTGGAGYLTVYACGARALVSSVNYVGGQTVANAVIAPVSPSGTVCFYSLQDTDLIVDINGWLATGSAFHAIDPARILDTRPGQSPDALRDVPETKIGGGNVLEVRVTDLAGRVPAGGVSAVSLNVTATNPDGPGYITVYACGALESVSSVNFDAGATVANAVLAPVSATGTICLFSNVTTDAIVDINGWIEG